MKMMSILCLMMTLRGGFANPVAGEGGSNSGLGFVAAVADSFNPLFSFFVNDAINDDSQVKVDDAIEHGRWYNLDSVQHLGVKFNVQNEDICCEECQKTYKDTEFFGQTHTSYPTHAALTDCTCMKSKPGFLAQTYALGFESGKCGLWTYNGDGDLGSGRIISKGVTIMGVVTNVSDASKCCESCMAMDKFPATHLFDFSQKNKHCKCYKTKIDAVPVTTAKDYSIGTCSATEVTEAPIIADQTMNDAHGDVTDAPKIDDQMMNDAPAVTSEEVDGDLGDGKIFNPNTLTFVNYTDANAVDECCSKCQALNPDARFFAFSRDVLFCTCFTPIDGVTPVSMDPTPTLKKWITNPVDGVCAATEVNDAPAAVTDASVAVTDATSKGEVSEPAVSVEEKSESDASADSGNVPDAEALTITTTTVKPEICSGSFVCCPHLTDGDNKAGTEKFIQESEYEDSFSSCEDACKTLHPFSNGVTQSKTKTYTNGKPQCWCEFGQSVFHQSTGYQTCLFPVGEDDYDY